MAVRFSQLDFPRILLPGNIFTDSEHVSGFPWML
jgi:hypothetical protein